MLTVFHVLKEKKASLLSLFMKMDLLKGYVLENDGDLVRRCVTYYRLFKQLPLLYVYFARYEAAGLQGLL